MAYSEERLEAAKSAAVCHLDNVGMTDIADRLTTEVGEAILHIRDIGGRRAMQAELERRPEDIMLRVKDARQVSTFSGGSMTDVFVWLTREDLPVLFDALRAFRDRDHEEALSARA
jgi:hypothetical protein